MGPFYLKEEHATRTENNAIKKNNHSMSQFHVINFGNPTSKKFFFFQIRVSQWEVILLMTCCDEILTLHVALQYPFYWFTGSVIIQSCVFKMCARFINPLDQIMDT